MRNVTVVDGLSENIGFKTFNTLCKYTNPFNECVMPYMKGNKFKTNSFSVGVDIECNNKVTEFVLYSINTAKKYLILGNILR